MKKELGVINSSCFRVSVPYPRMFLSVITWALEMKFPSVSNISTQQLQDKMNEGTNRCLTTFLSISIFSEVLSFLITEDTVVIKIYYFF